MVYHLNQSGVVWKNFFTLKMTLKCLAQKRRKVLTVPQLWSGRKVLMVLLIAPRGLFSKTEMSHIYYKLHHQDFSPDQKWSTFWTFLFFSNLHHEDLSPNQNGKFVGHNVLLVLTFSFFEHHRGPRVLPLAFSDCPMYFFHFRFSGVATSKPSLWPYFWSKEQKTLNAHISKSLF